MSTDDAGGASVRPPLKVIRGDATPEEIAAIVAVLAAAGGSSDPAGGTRRRPSRWAAPSSRMRAPLAHGTGAWRGSALPH